MSESNKNKFNPKRLGITLLTIFAILTIAIIIYQLAWTAHIKEVKQKKDIVQSTVEKVDYIKKGILDNISDDAKRWFANNGFSYSLNNKEISVNVRVTSPNALALVADSIIDATKIYVDSGEYSIKIIYVVYYSESNTKGIDTDSMISWFTTNDGTTGLYSNNPEHKDISCSLDELYNIYNDFGKK